MIMAAFEQYSIIIVYLSIYLLLFELSEWVWISGFFLEN